VIIQTLALGLEDEMIIEVVRIEQPAKVAIDAPFGWPTAFVTAVSEHAAGANWRSQPTKTLRLRATDLHVVEQTRQQPLSVAADRIAVTAFRCAGLLTALAEAGHATDRSGRGLVVEVYPAGALRQWNLDPRGYKGSKPEQRAKRAQLVDELLARTDAFLSVDEEQRLLLAASDHSLDALICALIARASLVQATLPIPEELEAVALIEGWIALPRRGSLSELTKLSVQG
jgi:hypothetical protein